MSSFPLSLMYLVIQEGEGGVFYSFMQFCIFFYVYMLQILLSGAYCSRAYK